MSNYLSIQLLISGIILGIIFFQTALSAPIVFKYLIKNQSSIYIRKIFPKIFGTLFVLGCLSALINMFSSHLESEIQLFVSLATAVLSFICYVLIPATNRATDSGNAKKFKILHALSVGLTLTVFFANLAWPFFFINICCTFGSDVIYKASIPVISLPVINS
jgi:uncharacterized membrane protein SirB2